MKIVRTENKELAEVVLEGLRRNDWFCISIMNSHGDDTYKCICKDFMENAKVGDYCLCGLYRRTE